jgi:putative transposase
LNRSTWQYRSIRKRDDEPLKAAICKVAERRRRFGQEQIFRILRREGWRDGRHRVARLYRALGLSLRLKRRRKRASAVRVPMPRPTRINQVWSMDFVHDRLANGRVIKCLVVVDEYSRECLAIEVDFGISGERVIRVLNRLIELYGKPQAIRSDNGPEFAGNAMDAWAYETGVKLDFIQPGKPTQNAFCESFNGRFREECLNDNQFKALVEAQVVIEAWRKDFNEERPHSSLNGLTPSEFAARLMVPVPQLDLA